MAEAIERRRRERGLGPGEFARAAGITAQGLRPVRQGIRKAYQDRVLLGVARALAWPDDWYELLLAGQEVSSAAEPDLSLEERVTAVEEAVIDLRSTFAEVLERIRELAP